MKYDVAHVLLRVSPARCAEIFFDPAFAQAMKSAAGTKSLEVLERDDDGARVRRRMRIVPERGVPAPFRAMVRGEIAIVEESVFDRAALCVTWRSVPTVLTEKLELSGTTTFRAVESGVERRIAGEVRVRVAGVGAMIERMLVSDLTAAQGRIARFAQEWIDREAGA